MCLTGAHLQEARLYFRFIRGLVVFGLLRFGPMIPGFYVMPEVSVGSLHLFQVRFMEGGSESSISVCMEL